MKMFGKFSLLLLALSSSPIFSSTTYDFDERALDLATALSHCSNELKQLQELSDYFATAKFSAPRPVKDNFYTHYYTVEAVKGGGFIEAKKVATLHIEKSVDNSGVAKDMPADIKYKCLVKSE